MRNISERDLSVVISLLAKAIREMTDELRIMDSRSEEMSDEQVDEYCGLQECLEQYTNILHSLRQEYESALAEGINLPSYEDLTRAPGGG